MVNKIYIKLLVGLVAFFLPSFQAMSQTPVGEEFVENGITYKVTSLNPNEVSVVKINNLGTSLNLDETVTNNSVQYTVTTIGTLLCYENLTLQELTLPNSIRVIEESAFEGCENLASVTLPQNNLQFTAIGIKAFCDCSSLESITIPNSVTTISVQAFQSTGLKNVVIPNSVTTIDGNAFALCIQLENVALPQNENFTSIDEMVFGFCSSLKSITIPNSVTEILTSAFMNCANLESIELSNSLETIEDAAFIGCKSLKTITLPSKVKNIGIATFSGCIRLVSITSNNPEPPTCEQNAFAAYTPWELDGVNKDIPVFVPNGSESDYKNATGWDYFNGTITKVEDSLIGNATEVARFDLFGRKITKQTAGVNIVCYSNGTTQKEFVQQ